MDYRLNLSSFGGAAGSFAVDLVGPGDGMVFEGASPTGTAQITSLKIGTLSPGQATLRLVDHGLTVNGPLVVADTGSALVQVTQSSSLTVQGPTTIHAGGTMELDGGSLTVQGSIQTFGTLDFGGDDPDQASDGILDLSVLPSGDPGANIGLRIGGGSGDAVLNGRAVVRVGGHGLIRVQGGSLQVDEGYTLAVRGIPVVHASTLEEPPPDCTNGDCEPPPDCTNGDCEPPPDCTNGDCEPPPDCSNGDCEPPPDCSNGDCTTRPESSNVDAQSITVVGQLLLEGGYVRAEDGMTIAQTGRLAGAGLIEGSVVNAGLVEPGHSPGSISIEGDFQQGETGRLVLEIVGDSQFDQLIVTGSADLGGTLEIVLRDGYRPGPGDVFPLVEANDPAFHFADVLVVGGLLNVSFSSQGLIASGVPEPASAPLLVLGSLALLWRRVRRRCGRPAVAERVIALAAVACVPATAMAVGYASGVSQSGSTVSFVLNQDNCNARVVLDDSAGTLDLGTLNKGTHSFDLTGYSSFQINVRSVDAGGWTQISTDNTDTSFYVPVGVSVNRNPGSANFGSIYVSNATSGTTTFGRETPEGLYRLRADATAINSGTAGVTWGSSAGPFKSAVGADDRLYVSDLSNDLVYDVAPDLSSAVQLITAENRTPNQWVASVAVTGTQAAGDRKIYLVDSNYNDPVRKGVIEYNLGGSATVATGDTGTQLIGPSYFAYYPVDAVRDNSGNWYTGQYRYVPTEASALAKFRAGGLPGNTPAWEVPKEAPYNGGYAFDLYEERGWVAYGNYHDGWVHTFDMDDGAYISGFDAGERMRDIAFDAAGNIYTVDTLTEWLKVWSPGGDWTATTGSDGAFSLAPVPVTIDLGTLNQGPRSPTPQWLDPQQERVHWYRFNLPETVDDVDNRFLVIDTIGSSLSGGTTTNDTEIGLYDAAGNRVAIDDDDGPDYLSRLAFGNEDGNLFAGQYYLAASAYPTTHNPTAFDVQSTSTAEGNLAVNFFYGTDVGAVGEGTTTTSAQALSAGEVQFYRFELTGDVLAAGGTRLVIDTFGSILDYGNDTEIGLYDADGNWIANNDDWWGQPDPYLSQLVFGAGSAIALPAGTYYVATGAYNTTFGASFFNVDSSSPATGDIVLNFTLSVLPVGDYNGNGTVDAADYTVWRDNYSGPGVPGNPVADGDGDVDDDDYLLWKSHFGETWPGSGAGAYLAPGDWPGADSAAVPEPSALALLVTGALALTWLRRRGTLASLRSLGAPNAA